MKARPRAALIAAATAALLVGCGAVSPGDPPSTLDGGAHPSPGSSSNHESVPNERRIVLVVTGEGALATPVASINDLAADARTSGVVFGHVSEVEDFCANNAGYRLLTVRVSSAAKGRQGDVINVVEDGGIVPGSCIAPVVDGKFGETVKFGPNDFVDFRIEGHPHTQVGAEVVAFIGPYNRDAFGASHQLVGGLQGLLVKSGDRFVRSVLQDVPGVEASIPAADAVSRLSTAARG